MWHTTLEGEVMEAGGRIVARLDEAPCARRTEEANMIAAAPKMHATLSRIRRLTADTTWVEPEYKLQAINTIVLAALAAAEGKEG